MATRNNPHLRRLRLAALSLSSAAILLAGPSVALGKEFIVDGIVACGTQSGQVCQSAAKSVRVLTEDLGGERLVTIDLSWLDNVTGFQQDQLVCYSVEPRADGVLQALSWIEPCPPQEDLTQQEENQQAQDQD